LEFDLFILYDVSQIIKTAGKCNTYNNTNFTITLLVMEPGRQYTRQKMPIARLYIYNGFGVHPTAPAIHRDRMIDLTPPDIFELGTLKPGSRLTYRF
jgi:hypothetical protein